jgi:uncharacterized protein YyaL (SSP411 family)
MMINSLFTLGQIDHKYTEQAIKNLDTLLETMFLDGVLYHTTLIHKTPKVAAFLEDYAFLAQALIAAFKQTQDEIYLIHAQRFANKALEEFYNKGDWNFSIGEFVTQAEIHDFTYISSVAVIVDVLLSLGTLLEDEKYTHFAFKTMEYNSYELGRKTIYAPHMFIQVLRYLKGDRVVKSKVHNLLANSSKLATLSYPFVQFNHSDDEGFMICGDKSCFANTQDLDKINDLIQKSI